jgi:hypothetical protein
MLKKGFKLSYPLTRKPSRCFSTTITEIEIDLTGEPVCIINEKSYQLPDNWTYFSITSLYLNHM